MSNKNGTDKKQDERILKIEVKFEEYCKRVDKFLSNEFPHFKDDVQGEIKETNNKIDNLTSKLLYGFVIGIASILIMQVILFFFQSR